MSNLPGRSRSIVELAFAALICASEPAGFAGPAQPALSPTNIFAPASSQAQSILEVSNFVLVITASIFVVVFSLLAYALWRFRKRRAVAGREPAQVYGSSQLELAWTVVPVLIVGVLFLATARVIADVQQQTAATRDTLEVTVVGHQFWWSIAIQVKKW